MSRPKPTALKVLQGNPGKRPLNENEPRPTPEAPAMPRGVLGKHGRKLWREHAEKLAELGILTEVDGPAFTFLCAVFDAGIQAAVVVREDGILNEDDRGRVWRSRGVTVLKQMSAEFRQWAGEFGLTPAMRSKLSIPAPDEPDALELLLMKRDGKR